MIESLIQNTKQTVVEDLTRWEHVVNGANSSKINGTVTLSVNKSLKIARIYFNITKSYTLDPSESVTVYTNSTYGSLGGFTSIPLRRQGLIMGINNAGNLIIQNLFTGSTQSTGTGSYSITYACK